MTDPVKCFAAQIMPKIDCPYCSGLSNEIDRLRAELAQSKKHAEDMNDGWRTANFENHDLCAEINRLRAELAAAQTIATRERAEADVQIERRIEVEAELATACAQRDVAIIASDGFAIELAAKDARIAELETMVLESHERVSELAKDCEYEEARAERAEAHVVDLEEIVKGVHFLRKKAEAELDGRNLAVIYCMERVEEDMKLLREALEGMIAVAEGRFDGNPHADIDALAKARAVALHLDRRPRQ